MITCMLGPSGCGKTTLLNMLNGHGQPDSGSIRVWGTKGSLMCFRNQTFALENSDRECHACVEGLLPDRSQDRAWKYLEMVELKDFGDYYPSQLSGGMKQRVSLARAFSYPADLILMDEPFSSLDARLKENLLKAFIRLWEIDQRTVVFVTHEPDEAIQVAHEIVVLSKPPVSIKKTFTKDDLKEISSGVREKIIGLIE